MRWAERCFSSLKNSTVCPDIFVVDNGSTDGTQEFIKEHYPEVMFHQSEENLGFGKANNIGLQYALDHDYDYVYLLNQDAWIFPETIEKLIEISRENPEYGILSPFQMNSDLYHIDQGFVSNVCSFTSNPDIFSDIYIGKINDVYPVSGVMAAHWFMTRRCIKIVGGFSPSFYHYGEDDNYQDRVIFWNIKIGIVPKLKVVHDRGTRVDSPKSMIYNGYAFSIRQLSKPQRRFFNAYLYILKVAFNNVRLYKSYLPISYFLRMILDSRRLYINRRISIKRQCAFLSSI